MANKYPLEIRIEIIMLFGENQRNLTKTLQAFKIKYPQYENISFTTVSNLISKFLTKGYVHDIKPPGRPLSATNDEQSELVLASTSAFPKTSTNKRAQECGISQSSVNRILRKHKHKPYKIHLVQELHGDDTDRRLEFCEWAQQHATNIKNIIFSDEAIFYLSGHVNRHNCRYWSSSNPHWIDEISQHDPRVMVWCGIHYKKIIGPYFFTSTVTAASYKEVLQSVLEPYIDDLPLHDLRNTFFQQDGAPPHFGLSVREWLDKTFQDRWIGRRGPVEWPPRSPDLSPLDFFLWGHLKSKVYENRPRTIEQLKVAITFNIALVSEDTLAKLGREWTRRIADCIQVNGQQFEQLY